MGLQIPLSPHSMAAKPLLGNGFIVFRSLWEQKGGQTIYEICLNTLKINLKKRQSTAFGAR